MIASTVLRKSFFFVLALFLFIPSNVKGAPITDPSQLRPNPTIIDFENLSSFTNPLIIGDVTFTSVTASLSLLTLIPSNWPVAGVEAAGTALFPGGEPDSAIRITFANPVSEFLLGWGDPNFSGNFLRAYDSNDNLLEEIAVPIGPVGGVFATWVGFKRPTAEIASVIVQPDQSYWNGDDYVIDNIHYNVVAVPQPVPIDIEPWFKFNIIDWKFKWAPIRVAILSKPDFDAPRMIDRSSLTFGPNGDEESLAFCNPLSLDINADKSRDLICFFYTGKTGFQCGDTTGILRGMTKDGVPIEGSDSVKIIPCRFHPGK